MLSGFSYGVTGKMEIPTLLLNIITLPQRKEKRKIGCLFWPGFPMIYPAGEPVNTVTSQIDALPFIKVQLAASAPHYTNQFLAHCAQPVN